MATLHKFKLLATQCAVAGSPGRSPTASPVVHLRRRKTLRMLLNRSPAERRRFNRRHDETNFDLPSPPAAPPAPPPPQNTSKTDRKKNSSGKKSRRKLKELFVASPPFEERDSNINRICEDETEDLFPVNVNSDDRFSSRGSNSLRPITTSLRYRLLRRAWRPMLVTIPE